jgi:hypothetical protein
VSEGSRAVHAIKRGGCSVGNEKAAALWPPLRLLTMSALKVQAKKKNLRG